MAGINDYSNTAGSNTTINGIDISEGCSPAGINNAIRQLMADIADMDDGVVPLQTPDINGGTIDGASLGASSPITSAVISGDLTVDTNTLYVDSSNNRVGVNTTSPATALDVSGSIFVSSILRNTNGGTAAVPSIQPGNDDDTGMFWAASNTVGFSTTGSERMRIDSSGNVGIGTTSPLSKLDVFGPSSVTSFTGTSHLGLTVRGSSAATDYSGVDFIGNNQINPIARVGVLTTGSGSSLSFGTSNNYASGVTNTAMTIDPSSKVGIGTTSPSESLHIATTNGGKIRFGFGGFSIDSGLVSAGDMDNFKTSGFYRFDTAVSNTPTSHIYATVIFGNGSNVVTQIATRIANTITYVRSFNTSWTSWVRLD